MVQLIELPAVVDLYHDEVKILLSPGGRGREFDSFKDHIFFSTTVFKYCVQTALDLISKQT